MKLTSAVSLFGGFACGTRAYAGAKAKIAPADAGYALEVADTKADVTVSDLAFVVADDVLVPDLAGWRRERMPEIPSTPFTTLAPDWLCEVLSPSAQKLDRGEKLPLYARERVAHVWLLDPLEQYLEVLRLDGETYRIVATFIADAKVRAEPFDAIELDLAMLWAR